LKKHEQLKVIKMVKTLRDYQKSNVVETTKMQEDESTRKFLKHENIQQYNPYMDL
jgi:hypothetical protein